MLMSLLIKTCFLIQIALSLLWAAAGDEGEGNPSLTDPAAPGVPGLPLEHHHHGGHTLYLASLFIAVPTVLGLSAAAYLVRRGMAVPTEAVLVSKDLEAQVIDCGSDMGCQGLRASGKATFGGWLDEKHEEEKEEHKVSPSAFCGVLVCD